MAKKQQAPGKGLIITLVFFVLATFLTGTLAYFAYSDNEQAVKDKQAAEKKAKDAEAAMQAQEARRLLLKVAMGTASPEDRQNFEFLQKPYSAAIKTEFDDLNKSLTAALPNGARDFTWAVVGDKPDVSPSKTIPQIVQDYAKAAQEAAAARQTAEAGAKKSEEARQAAEKKAADEKVAFDKAIADLKGQLAKVTAEKDDKFKEYQAGLAKAGEDYQAMARKLQDTEDKLTKEIDFLTKKRDELQNLIAKYEQRSPPSVDLVQLDRPKGVVERRDGTFVYINLGSAHYLRPQTTFTVLPSEGTWRNIEEREAQIKGQIEVVEVIGPYSSRAKILNEGQPIRNPIRSKDPLFNLAWSPNAREHIAFAGIIDMNGDGLDDNLEFIRFLEKQGIVIDSWLDLRDRQIKGKGMSLSTKLLVMGPRVEISEDEARRNEKDPRFIAKQEVMNKMGQMEQEARKLGVQLVDYRKFLAMTGYKVPERPAPPEYGASSYIRRGEGGTSSEPKDDLSVDPKGEPKKKDDGR